MENKIKVIKIIHNDGVYFITSSIYVPDLESSLLTEVLFTTFISYTIDNDKPILDFINKSDVIEMNNKIVYDYIYDFSPERK